MPALLQVDSQRRYELGERTRIGRAAGNSIQLDDPMISGSHAEIVRGADGEFVVRDLGSRHGTYVGSTKIEQVTLRDGDELLLGPVRLVFEAGSVGSIAREVDELRTLRAVVELGKAIGVEHDLEKLLARVLETCFQLLRADRGVIVVYAPGSKAPTASISRARSGEVVDEALSSSVLSQLMASRDPYLRTEVDADLALKRSESLSAQGVRSLVAVPLLYQNTEWLGVLYLDSRAASKVFVQKDLELLTAVGGQAALAIKNAMLVRQMQVAQTEEWQRLARVVANLPVGVVVLDDQRRCLVVNDWMARRADVLGRIDPWATVDQIASVPCERLAASDASVQVTLGEPEATFVVDSHTAANGRETVVVITDLTTARAQAAKAAHQDRLALIGQLAGGIAHDFNNLLFIITNYAEMLTEGLTDRDAIEDARLISQAATTATELVRQLLAFSRRETVRPAVVDVAAVVATSERLLAKTLGDKIAFTLDAEPGPHHVLIDPSQLEQIVMNLIVNARDATQGEGCVKLQVGTAGGMVVLSVSDTGSGMAPEVAAHIFEPYFTTKSLGKGTGLGLATVHGIVEHVGGRIEVITAPGQGATFRVSLPATTVEPTQAPELPEAQRRGRVLVVDDDDTVLRLTERMLRQAGYAVVPAHCGPDALAEVRRGSFDIVLTDMVMPGMSGRELARELARISPHTRIVFMSGYHPGTPIPEAQFLAKPFDRKALLAKLDAPKSEARAHQKS